MSPIVFRQEEVIVILMKGKTDYRSLERGFDRARPYAPFSGGGPPAQRVMLRVQYSSPSLLISARASAPQCVLPPSVIPL